MLWETIMECYVAKIMVLGLFLGSNILSSACTLFKTPNHTDRHNEILKKKKLVSTLSVSQSKLLCFYC